MNTLLEIGTIGSHPELSQIFRSGYSEGYTLQLIRTSASAVVSGQFALDRGAALAGVVDDILRIG